MILHVCPSLCLRIILAAVQFLYLLDVVPAMREQETVAVKQVQTAYRAQVKAVEAQIKTLEQANRNQNKGGRKK